MSAIASTTANNPIVTRQRKKRDLETTMNTLKQLLEPTMKKGSRKKNKPRSLAKKVVPPKPVSRFENSKDDGEYYPNKLKRKVRLKKTILRPKHELKVVVATNKRKRGTPHKGLDHCVKLTDWQNIPTAKSNSMYANTETNNTICNPSIHNVPPDLNDTSVQTNLHVQSAPNISVPNVHRECYVHTKTQSTQNLYKLISPPHKSLTQLTVDDLIRMDEDSLSGEDMMEILTCPSPVWWEDPAESAQGNVFLTKASMPTPKENLEVKRKGGLKRGSVNVSSTKAKKIAKLENILGHIKSLVTDVREKSVKNDNNMVMKRKVFDDNDVDNGAINKDDKNKATIEAETDRNTPEVNEIDRKRRKISSSSSEISVNEDELLRNLESINIPVKEQKDSLKLDKDNNSKESIDDIEEKKVSVNETQATTKRKGHKRGKKRLLKNKIESQDSKNQNKGKQDRNIDDNKNKEEINKPPAAVKSILEKLKNKNDDILDVRLIKVPTNVTNEVKVWSKLENFKRHNFKPSDFERNKTGDEYEIPISRTNINEQDPLELNSETILIDDDSYDCNVDDADDISVDNTHATITPTDKSSNEVIDLDSISKDTKDTESDKQEISDKTDDERSIIKEDTIRIGNDLDVRLIETSNLHKHNTGLDETNVKAKEKVIFGKRTEKDRNVESIENAKTDWHVNKYLKFDKKCNDRGIFRVDDPDDSTDTILCLNDVDVSLVKNPKSHDDKTTTVKVDESINDLSITLISKSDNLGVTITPMALPNLTKHSIVESPISIKSITSDSTENDTISDTNIQYIDEYDDKSHRNKTIDCIDLENEIAKEKDIELEEVICLTNEDIKIQENGDDSTDYDD